MSNILNQSRRVQGVLLYGMVRSKREEYCTWSMVGDSSNSVNSRNRLISYMLVANIPRPSFAITVRKLAQV